jgi:predicted nucleic acid-binding protein
MTTSIDSNIVVALWWEPDPLNRAAAQLLIQARKSGAMIVSAPAFAELSGDPNRSEAELDAFFAETGISIDWNLEEEIWREAGKAYRGYVQRRRSSSSATPRRILADFLIGAHALVRNYSLLTLDKRLYAAAFPKLKIISS